MVLHERNVDIVARIMRQAVGGSLAGHLSFARRALFDRAGMNNMILEPDPSGAFVRSLHSYVTASNWSGIGLLDLNDGFGRVSGKVPAGWVS